MEDTYAPARKMLEAGMKHHSNYWRRSRIQSAANLQFVMQLGLLYDS